MFIYTIRDIEKWLKIDKAIVEYVEHVQHDPYGTVTVTIRGSQPVAFCSLTNAASYIRLCISSMTDFAKGATDHGTQ